MISFLQFHPNNKQACALSSYPSLSPDFACWHPAIKKNATPSPTAGDYTRLSPGNYWIYESFVVDTAGNATPGSDPFNVGSGPVAYDSVYVEKDTVIGSNTYHKLMTPDDAGSHDYTTAYLRDSMNYEVDNYGVIRFAANDFTTIFRTRDYTNSAASADSTIHIQQEMSDKDKSVTVPAGTFTTSAFLTNYTFYPYKAAGTPPYSRGQYVRYAAGVGIITETLPFYVSVPYSVERRLVRYHLD